MLQSTLGGLDSPIVAPPGTLDLVVYLDAGGRQAENRVWAGLAALGECEVRWIERTIEDLKQRYADSVERSGELKGKGLALEDVKQEGRSLHLQGRRIRFWVNWYPRLEDPRISQVPGTVDEFLAGLSPNPDRIDRKHVKERYEEMAIYFRRLKPVNRHKVISILAHFQWLADDLHRCGLGPQLGSAKMVIDREDFPRPSGCANLLKGFVAASLQAVGMSRRLTGRAFRETPEEGAVVVEVHADSVKHAGLQYCDLLLQAVQRKLSMRGHSVV